MKKLTKKLVVVLCLMMLATAMVACGDGGKTDAVTGTWKQTDEVDGNWVFTFCDGSKVKFVGETTGFESEGTYTLDETNKKLTVTLEKWDPPKEFSYTLNGNNLDLEETYTHYHLVKQ